MAGCTGIGPAVFACLLALPCSVNANENFGYKGTVYVFLLVWTATSMFCILPRGLVCFDNVGESSSPREVTCLGKIHG